MGDRCLLIEDVAGLVKRRKTWIYGQVRAGTFPTSDDGRWHLVEIEAWLEWRRYCKNVGRNVGRNGPSSTWTPAAGQSRPTG